MRNNVKLLSAQSTQCNHCNGKGVVEDPTDDANFIVCGKCGGRNADLFRPPCEVQVRTRGEQATLVISPNLLSCEWVMGEGDEICNVAFLTPEKGFASLDDAFGFAFQMAKRLPGDFHGGRVILSDRNGNRLLDLPCPMQS